MTEITRGREPITVRLTTAMNVFIVSAVVAIVGAATFLKILDIRQLELEERDRDQMARIGALERQVQLLEWQLQSPQRNQ